jgi:hypothetical protein
VFAIFDGVAAGDVTSERMTSEIELTKLDVEYLLGVQAECFSPSFEVADEIVN